MPPQKIPMRIIAEHLPPAFARALYDGGGIKGIVKDSDYIVSHDMVIMPLEGKLKVGQAFVLSPALKGCYLQYQSDIDEYNRQRRLKEEAKRQAEFELAVARSKAFWRQYDIPISFVVEIKESLSGLSSNSSGNGEKHNSVFHLYCQEQVQEYRLVRSAGSFLCSPVKAHSGGDWSGTLGNGITFLSYTPPVTCKQCLKLMERWKINS